MDSETVSLWGRDSLAWAELTARADNDNPLWPVYAPLLTARDTGRPLVVGQIGQSLDGRVATDGGRAQMINGPSAIVHLHRLRALVDAVVVGVGTVIADDPRLTVRDAAGVSPARVIIDPTGRLPAEAELLRNDGARRIVFAAGPAPSAEGVETIVMPGGEFAPAAILSALAERGLKRVLIEGGPRTLSRFIAARQLDRLHFMIAPIIIGSGQLGVQLPIVQNIDAALRPRTHVYPLPGGDVLFDCAFGGASA